MTLTTEPQCTTLEAAPETLHSLIMDLEVFMWKTGFAELVL